MKHALWTFIVLTGCAATSGARRPTDTASNDVGRVQEGEASFYSDSLAGRHTASGAPYDPEALMAAHRTLPFGTRIRVTRVDTARSVEVVVNDRGPFAGHDRIVDLSRCAARALDMERRGVVAVRLEVITLGSGARVRRAHER